ncbi:hypothetical protein WT98_04290 [Burkholderia territorii]|nr:hypothetical protein WT98_04290 [Burkholderia territorii]
MAGHDTPDPDHTILAHKNVVRSDDYFLRAEPDSQRSRFHRRQTSTRFNKEPDHRYCEFTIVRKIAVFTEPLAAQLHFHLGLKLLAARDDFPCYHFFIQVTDCIVHLEKRRYRATTARLQYVCVEKPPRAALVKSHLMLSKLKGGGEI